MKIYGSLICLILFVTSCYNEDDISTIKGEIPYVVSEGSNDVDTYIYNFYKENGSIIRYDFDTVEYRWNVNNVYNDVVLKKIELGDKENKSADEIQLLNDGLSMMKKVFIDLYDVDFKKKYFPLNIFMADAVNKMVWGNPVEQPVLVGKGYIAIGGIRAGVGELSESELLDIKKKVNAEFWLTYLIRDSRIFIPEKFYEVSKSFYGKNLGLLPENSGVSEIDVKNYGFWSKNTAKAWMTEGPNRDEDLKEFITTIITTPYSELKPIFDKYSLLRDKYNIITNRLVSKYGVDLQAIGNKN